MPIELTNFNKLIAYLWKASEARLSDEEPESLIDEDGQEVFFEFRQWGQIVFSNPNDKLKELRQSFDKEFTNNQYTKGFDLNSFVEDAISQITDLKELFTLIPISGIDIKLRNDFKVKYLDYIEYDFREDGDDVRAASPREIVLTKDQYDAIPERILIRISEYFTFQEKFINELFIYLNTYSKKKSKRAYNQDYRLDYFKFNLDKIGNIRRSPKESIKSFFTALVENGYIEGEESIEHLTKFFSNKKSTRVIWTVHGKNLFYMIRKLNSDGYIIDAKGSWTNIIPEIFVKKDGSDFTDNELNSSTASKKITPDLDRIIRLLGQ